MPKPKVVITDQNFPDLEMEKRIFGDADCELVDAECKDAAEVIAAAADADALLVNGAPITAEVIEALSNCKVIVRYGVGYDDIDVEAAAAKGIAVCNVPDATTEEVADHTVALALALGRQLPQLDKRLREGAWDVANELVMPAFQDMSFGAVGFGRIARAVLERAGGFKFRLVATDPHVEDKEFEQAGVLRLSLDDLLREADIISLHSPLTPETHHLINADRFEQMEPGVILINTGRGALVDTDALLKALESKRVAYAGLDVFEEEPLPPAHPLCRLDNVLLTPHIASYSESSTPEIRRLAAEEVVRALRGEPLRSQVNGN